MRLDGAAALPNCYTRCDASRRLGEPSRVELLRHGSSQRLTTQALQRFLDRDFFGGEAGENGPPIWALDRRGRTIAERGDDIVEAAAGRVIGDLQLAGNPIDIAPVFDQDSHEFELVP